MVCTKASRRSRSSTAERTPPDAPGELTLRIAPLRPACEVRVCEPSRSVGASEPKPMRSAVCGGVASRTTAPPTPPWTFRITVSTSCTSSKEAFHPKRRWRRCVPSSAKLPSSDGVCRGPRPKNHVTPSLNPSGWQLSQEFHDCPSQDMRPVPVTKKRRPSWAIWASGVRAAPSVAGTAATTPCSDSVTTETSGASAPSTRATWLCPASAWCPMAMPMGRRLARAASGVRSMKPRSRGSLEPTWSTVPSRSKRTRNTPSEPYPST